MVQSTPEDDKNLHVDPLYLSALASLSTIGEDATISASTKGASVVTSTKRSSIAVLPFVNMGGGADGEAFADGISEDVITAISRHSELFVVARTSSFAFKGKTKDIKSIAGELGVRYILEGSVRRSNERIRVTAQLIDAADGQHVWAEKYDGTVDDVFEIQDKVTIAIAQATHTELLLNSWSSRDQAPHGNPRAWELAGQAQLKLYEHSREAIVEGARLAEQALEIEPTNARALRMASLAISTGISMGLYPSTSEYLGKAIEFGAAAVKASRRDEHSRHTYSWALANAGQDIEALRQLEIAIEINPSYSIAHADLAECYVALGQTEKALAAVTHALQLNPIDPSNYWRYSCLASIHFVDERYDLSFENAKRSAYQKPDFARAWLHLAAASAALDKTEEARKAIDACLSILPEMRLSNINTAHFPRYSQEDTWARLIAMLRRAGLPE